MSGLKLSLWEITCRIGIWMISGKRLYAIVKYHIKLGIVHSMIDELTG
jgi:hypothetical protein